MAKPTAYYTKELITTVKLLDWGLVNGAKAFSMMTLILMGLNATLNINEAQHKATLKNVTFVM